MNRAVAPAVIALLAAACGTPEPVNQIRVSGHVEATETRLAPDAGGRVLEIAVTEGERLETGDLVVRLDPKDVELALARARAEREQADAQLRLLRAGARTEDIRQAEAQVASARADVEAARAELTSAAEDLKRFESLVESNSGSRKQRDDAATRRDVARERVRAAESRVRAAEEAVARLKAGARREEIDAARARVAAVDAQLATLEENLSDTTLTSPVTGIVTEKLVETGEVIAPRTPVAVVVDLDDAWADVFVPEPMIPRLRLGQEATLFTDAGGEGLKGTITWISPKAEFTPRNVQTADERSKLVYRVRVSVDNRAGMLKVGMPIEAEMQLQPQ
ncbi:MAG: HlyD family secretion protein [Vicinamibacterales bacterium]